MSEPTGTVQHRFRPGERVLYRTMPLVGLPATVLRLTAKRVIVELDDPDGFAPIRVFAQGSLTSFPEAAAAGATTPSAPAEVE
jgi:hypothetical protein